MQWAEEKYVFHYHGRKLRQSTKLSEADADADL